MKAFFSFVAALVFSLSMAAQNKSFYDFTVKTIDGKEYPFISRIQSGLPGVKLIDAPDDLIKLLSNSPSDNTDN